MKTLHPVSIFEFNNNVNIRFKNIIDGFDLYKHFQIYGDNLNDFELNMISFLDEVFQYNNNECFVDLYINNLTSSEKNNLLNICPCEDKEIISEHININHNTPYYKLYYKDLIPFLVRLNTREIFFVTFYFAHIPITIWGNYNLTFPCFAHDDSSINFYRNIALKHNLLVK